MWPVRTSPGFAATLKRTLAVPVPLDGCETEIHGESLTASHAQALLLAVIVNEPFAPAAGTFALDADSENVQPLLCVIAYGCPPIESVALRCGPLFAATVYCTVPLPEPLAPLVIVIHDTGDDALHGQPELLVTFTLPGPPEALVVAPLALSE
jgi:hypothetical protein